MRARRNESWLSGKEALFSAKSLVKLIVPLFFEQLLAVTIGMADTMMVAGCGEAAVSGISVVDAISILFITIFSALSTGGAVVCAQYLGKQDRKNACKSAKQLLYSCFAIALIIAVVVIIFRDDILRLIYGNLEADVMESASIYFLITSISLPFFALYSGAAAIFRTMGNSKISLYASIIMNIINIGGNATLIMGFGMEADGAAIATLAARVVGAVFLLALVGNPTLPVYVLDMFKPEIDFKHIKLILKVGIPSGLENSMFQVGKLCTQGIITSFGTASIAANAVSGSIVNLLYLCGGAVSLSLITVVGRCVGAGDYKQAKKYTLLLVLVALTSTFVFGTVLYLISPWILSLFKLSSEASLLAIKLIKWNCVVSVFLHELAFVLPNALRAAGDVRFTMIISIISMWTMRVFLSYIFAYTLSLGVFGVWLAMYSDWVVRAICFIVRFISGRWRNRAVV